MLYTQVPQHCVLHKDLHLRELDFCARFETEKRGETVGLWTEVAA